MPRQIGVIKVKGKLDDLSLYKSKDGYMVRMKGGVDKDRIANDPAFARTRENNSEFGRAGKDGKTIRRALNALVHRAKNGRASGRLVKLIMSIYKTDTVSPRGQRNLNNGDLALLNGFEFNTESPLASSFFAPFDVALDRSTGEVDVNIEAFTPLEAVGVPSGTTHFRIFTGSAELDLENDPLPGRLAETSWMSWDGAAVNAMTMTVQLSAGSSLPIITALGVEFGQEVNGQIYLLQNGSYNSLQIVSVNRV